MLKAFKYILDGILNYISTFLSSGVIELTPVFILIAMIGVLISMAGFRKTGVKVSSLSFLIYILLRAVL